MWDLSVTAMSGLALSSPWVGGVRFLQIGDIILIIIGQSSYCKSWHKVTFSFEFIFCAGINLARSSFRSGACFCRCDCNNNK